MAGEEPAGLEMQGRLTYSDAVGSVYLADHSFHAWACSVLASPLPCVFRCCLCDNTCVIFKKKRKRAIRRCEASGLGRCLFLTSIGRIKSCRAAATESCCLQPCLQLCLPAASRGPAAAPAPGLCATWLCLMHRRSCQSCSGCSHGDLSWEHLWRTGL